MNGCLGMKSSDRQTRKRRKIKICFVSGSGGHYEQLRRLRPLLRKYDGFWITEKTEFDCEADYYLPATGSNDPLVLFRMLKMGILSLYIWVKERPDVVITTGALTAVPMLMLAKVFRRKSIYIETFARVEDGSRAGQYGYRHSDLFIYQWEQLKKVYPNGVYGGSIY